jgi:hypothetical protein
MNQGSDACSCKMEGIVPGHVFHPQEIALCSFYILRPLISTKLPFIRDLRMTGMGRLATFSEMLYKRLMYDRVRQVTYRSPGL